MTKGILGKKLGMTQIFRDNGEVVPVTVIQAEPNVVLQKKEEATDGYTAVQLGVEDKKQSRINKPEQGHADKAGATPKRYVKEVRGEAVADYEVGQEVKVNTFAEGEYVDITGTSKGKGFQGAIKRHNQSRGPMSHGSRFHRKPGSMGVMGHYNVKPGKLLPGRMGGEQVTVQNLEIVKVDTERDLLLVKGNVPGPRKTYVTVKDTVKANN
ncbi:LSU ribosomal protein L3P [Salsuginibacillus halophilus]|uniref:Large ribosomal subunit protein uL3 n=1 Tax=Salsuginibacillus halophilus TaxID=517424 RepID=A0A2P8H8H6_9BACI|nr:50S ribosomal protein L3 [Salsuginibacillus halophilus]PSL42528.1 LSU ribosomal protein L3P [Salsuginibacillus halophilus]